MLRTCHGKFNLFILFSLFCTSLRGHAKPWWIEPLNGIYIYALRVDVTLNQINFYVHCEMLLNLRCRGMRFGHEIVFHRKSDTVVDTVNECLHPLEINNFTSRIEHWNISTAIMVAYRHIEYKNKRDTRLITAAAESSITRYIRSHAYPSMAIHFPHKQIHYRITQEKFASPNDNDKTVNFRFGFPPAPFLPSNGQMTSELFGNCWTWEEHRHTQKEREEEKKTHTANDRGKQTDK